MTDIEIDRRDAQALWLLLEQENYRVDAAPDFYSNAYRVSIARLREQLAPFAPADAITR